jgi:hypothetical protein
MGVVSKGNIIKYMATLNQLISEIAHSVGMPNNKGLRENIKLALIQTRNEVIRHSYENHGFVDKILTQRFKVSLTDINDGEIKLPEGYEDIDITKIKRTLQNVPRPVRLNNNLPFDRVSTVGYKTNKEIPFIKETTARFRQYVPGLCGMPCYDYINGYIYLFPPTNKALPYGKIVIESAFEHPNYIDIQNGITSEWDAMNDDNEWLFSEDMVGIVKDIIFKRDLFRPTRETNEIPNSVKFNV